MGTIDPQALYQNLLDDVASIYRPEMGDEFWPDITVKQAACLQLVKSFYKKFVSRVSPDADELALAKFQSINQDCGAWQLRLSTLEDELLVGELKNLIYHFWYKDGITPLVSSLNDLFDHCRCGPGAAVGARGNDLYTKLFDSPLTATSLGLYKSYMHSVSTSQTRLDAEIFRKEKYGEVSLVGGNRLCFVPKTDDISRLICIEPSLNIFFQLGFGAFLEKRLRSSFGTSLATQPDCNRELCRIGSLTQEYISIDLSSASDSMSLRMLKEFLPPSFLGWLELLRSKETTQPNGERLCLNMVSTMGNGFTFPLQTMFFTCIVFAAASVDQLSLGKWDTQAAPRNWGVFGDDIICPSRIGRKVLRLLELTGFVVNHGKTFVEGPFRESCGYDYFSGHNVRGVYIKTLRSQQSRYAAINNLNLWSARTGVSLRRTVQYLRSSVRWQPVPPIENDDAGIKVPFSFVTNDAGLYPRKDRNRSAVYDRSVARPLLIPIGERDLRTRGKMKKRSYNPNGLLASFLYGGIVDSAISVRLDTTWYSRKRGVTPNWDYLPSDCLIARQSDWQRWNTAVYFNLYG